MIGLVPAGAGLEIRYRSPGRGSPRHEPDLWDDVQRALKAHSSGTSRRLKVQQPSLLVGMLLDAEGRAMTPSHATRPGKRYRYYVTRPDLIDASPAWRVPAFDLEQLVCRRIAELLCDQQFLCRLAEDAQAETIQRAIAAGDLAAASLRSGSPHDRAALLKTFVDRINLGDGGIEIMIRPALIRCALELASAGNERDESIILALPATKVRIVRVSSKSVISGRFGSSARS